MNKRYRVIFNEATQTYTAVSEETPAKGKKASKATKALVATAIGLGATTITYASWVGAMNGGYGNAYDPIETGGTGNVYTGHTNDEHGIAMGTSNKATEIAYAGTNSIAIGAAANAAYNDAVGNAIAIGDQAKAAGNAIAFGANSSATANNIALGSGSNAIDLTAGQLSGSGVTLNNQTYNFAAANEANTLSIGSAGNERVITHVGAGQVSATSTHAVNGSQLYAAYGAINDLSDKTWSVQVNGNAAAAVGADDTVAFLDGKNIKVTQDANNPHNITIATADDVAFNSVVVGPVSINSNGINAGNRKITNVAAGTLSGTSTDAVNGSQLYATNTNVTNNSTKITNLENQTWKVQVNDGTATSVKSTDTVTFKDGDNIEVTQDSSNPNLITIATKKDVAFDSVTVGSVVLNSNGINAGNKKITNVAKGTLSSTSTDAVNGSQLYETNSKVDNHYNEFNDLKDQTWQIQVNGGKVTPVAEDAVVSFNEGKNISVTQDANDPNKLTIATKDDVAFNSVSVGSVMLNSTGINAGNKKITNVADGTIAANSKDAINGGQLYDAIGAGSAWTLISEDASGKAVETKISAVAPLAIKDDGKTTQVVLGKDADGKDTLTVSAATPLQYVDSTGNAAADQFKPTDNIVALVDKDGTTSAPVTLTNVKDGAINKDSNDAINGSQLYAAGSSIGDIIGGGGDFVGGQIVWNDKDSAGNTYNGIGNTGEYTIHDAIQYLNDKNASVSEGWFYTIDGKAVGQVAADGSFDFTSAATTVNGTDFDNITVSKGPNGDGIQVGLAKDIGVDSITVGESKITSAGGNLQIGQGTVAADTTGSIGLGKDYTINASNSLALGNNSVADKAVGTTGVTINNDKYTFAGTAPVGTVSVGAKDAERTITNVAAGQLTATSTDAVNGSQLYATNTAIEKLKNGADGVVQYTDPETPTTPNGGNKTNTATLVGKDADKPVTLTNVAPGKNGTDAVNVSQLNDVKNDLGKVSDRANAGTASAMATALLPQAYDAGSSMVGVGAADFDGEQGYAIGYSSVSEGGKWVVRAAGTGNSQEKFGVGASVGYRWG